MEITQRFTVEHPPAVVWDALADAPFAAQCMPGAELDESAGDGRHYKGRMRVKLGPLAAVFSGEATVDRNPAERIGTIDWVGVDRRSNSRSKARMTYRVLSEKDGKAAAVQIEADVTLTGALAQFGRSGIINDVAARLTSIFADNLQSRLTAAAASSTTAGESEPAEAEVAKTQSKAADLRLSGVILHVMRRRLAAWLRRWSDRLDPDSGRGA